jgi:hypothetical protein
MVVLQSINLALRFVLEIFALAAVAYWGFKIGKEGGLTWLTALGAPVFLAVIWGVFGSPKAVINLSPPLHFFVEVLTFGLPCACFILCRKAANRHCLYYFGNFQTGRKGEPTPN